jgi:hypothetical protein
MAPQPFQFNHATHSEALPFASATVILRGHEVFRPPRSPHLIQNRFRRARARRKTGMAENRGLAAVTQTLAQAQGFA